MRTALVIAVAVLVAAPSLARGQEPAPRAPADISHPTVDLPPALDRVLRDYEAAWSARDAARLAELFHEDGFVLSSGRVPVRGRAAILDHYRNSGGPLKLRAIAYATEGDIGWIIGMYAGATDEEVGKFVLALRRDGTGRWLIAGDMDNQNRR